MKKGTAQEFDEAVAKNVSTNIYLQLWKAKKEIGKINKSADNPFFKSKYADLNTILDVVEPILHKYGLVLIQPIENGKVCSQVIDIETKEGIYSDIELPAISDPQKLGICISYFRRYTLQSLLSLSMQDDDGNTATESVKNTKPTITQERFENGLSQIAEGKLTPEAFKQALSGYQLNELQTKALLLL